MASPGRGLRISAVQPNDNNRQGRGGNRVLERYRYRDTIAAAGNYNQLNSLKTNYLNNLGIVNKGAENAAILRQQGEPRASTEWIERPIFYQNAMDIADKFNLDRGRTPHTARLFTNAFAEYITELEKVIQKRVLNRDFIVDGADDRTKRAIFQQMSSSLQNIFMEGRGNIQSITELHTRTSSFNNSFWSEGQYKTRWSADFRALMDDTIRMLLQTFSANPAQSFFGILIPNLNVIPEAFTNTPRNRPKGYIYKMDGNRDYLRVIFNIMMVRFPTLNTARSDIWTTFTIPIWMNPVLTAEGESTDPFLIDATVYHTETSLKNLFYYIPNQERVLGIWPKSVRVNRGGDGTPLSTLNVNYNSQMIRSVLCKIRLDEAVQQNARVNYMMLFSDQLNNIYSKIRRQDPFGFGDLDPYIRLFVSMTFFSESNDKILHIPWTIESLDSPLVPNRVGDSEFIPYDFSELLRIIIIILEGRISGKTEEEDDGKIIYVIIKFISEHPVEYYRPQEYLIHQREQYAFEEEKSPRNVRQRLARTPQQQSLQAPKPSGNSVDGLIVGAPYAGTEKEKIFLNFSMVNRFQFNDALFETPQRPTTYSCFMMSVIRCQLYLYKFENGVCKDVLVTNGARADMTCTGKFVQATMDYSGCTQCLPFIRKMDGEYYIHLFNNVKHTMNGKYLSGARNEEENQYWELAADEIWLHLERFCQREVNYNDLGDYGQVFADFFNVCISIYDVEYRGNRIAVITPYNKSPSELAQDDEILMIHIVYDQGHIHAVNNLRNFIRSKKRKSDVRQTHYCPICDKKQTDVLTCSKESALGHITECVKECEKFKTGFQREEVVRVQSQHSQVRTTFKKVKGKNRMVNECTQCYQEVNQLNFASHVCTIQKRKLEYLPDEKIYVWDVEAAQLEDEFHLLKHECNCVYIRRVYFDPGTPEAPNPLAEGRYFPSEVEFVDALMTEAEFQNAVFLAHNSGSYDIHFLLRIFERNEIDHTFTPSPTSKHKFIKVHLTERNVHFLDFIRFMPGSLRSIAESFQISVSKGDFPYKFNNGLNDSYVGRIPPLDGPEDYWGQKEARSQKQLDSFRIWYNSQLEIYCSCDTVECTCEKKRWNFQEELKKYCLLDVVVLAEVVKAYRNKVLSFETVQDELFPDANIPWSIPKIDPFQFMTLPQITMQTLVHGMKERSYENYGFDGITSYFCPSRASRCPEAILWLKNCADIENVFIQSRENSTREFYEFQLKLSFDGYAPITNTVYIFLKCSFWGCPQCMREFHETNAIIPERGIPAKDVEEHYSVVMHHLHSNYKVKTIWQHDYTTAFMDPYYIKCADQMSPSDCFYGGRTEVFKLYCNSEKYPGQKIHYYDVTSLYPSVYAHRLLPIGTPRYIIGYNVDPARLNPNHPNRYFGYARVRVTPRNTDRIGLLPQRDMKTQRLTFPVHPMVGCWFTEELYLAIENGYVINEIYELYYWEPNQLSDQHLRGYVGYFLRMKQEAEGWKKLGASCENPSIEEQNEIADRLYVQNGNLARIRPEKVKFDPVMRALAKLFLNSLWGKWAQKAAKECQTTIYGTQQFFQLWNDWTVEKESCQFRDISPGVYKVSYKKKDPFINPVPHGNVWLAAAVTAWARITLHKQMIRIGPERLIYCDTDSIIFLWPEDGEKLSGVGLGHWTDEYPNHNILEVYALAPKLYALTVADKNNPENRKESFRAKGVQMTLMNQMKMSFQNILPMIEKTIVDKTMAHTIQVDNFSIFTNSTNNQLPFGNLFTRYNTKNVRVIMTKRTVEELLECDFETLAEINTFPPGYVSSPTSVTELN